MNFKKIFCLALCAVALSVTFSETAWAQRERVVNNTGSSRPTNQPPAAPPSTAPTTSSRPVKPMSQNIIVVGSGQNQNAPLVKKTVSDRPISAGPVAPVNRSPLYAPSINRDLMGGIQARLGIPYLYGSTGPNRYDCSGFVWRVFQDAGIHFTRASARSLYSTFEPVYGEDRFKFGTLVFLNGLGHMGIVADENGFYHASSSKGITYSPFKGYWANRIVGFRRVPVEGAP